MIIDFESDRIVKSLAKRLQSKAKDWDYTYRYSRALDVVAEAFGHKNYQSLKLRIGLADPSVSDRDIDPAEQDKRYRQYVDVLSQSGLSMEQAEDVVNHIAVGKWFGFHKDHTDKGAVKKNSCAPGPEVEFIDTETIHRLLTAFKRSIKDNGLSTEAGVRNLMARMFGYQSYARLLDGAAKGNPSIPDFYVSPEVLDIRVQGYLGVLHDEGFDLETSMRVLRSGYGGWLAVEECEWDPLRQTRHADRVEEGTGPRWRPRRLNGCFPPIDTRLAEQGSDEQPEHYHG